MKKVWKSLARDLWIVLLDVIAVNASYFLALLIRFYVNFEFRPTVSRYIPDFLHFAPFYTVLCIAVFALFRLYGGMWRYAGINDMNRIIAASLATALVQVIGTALFVERMPISYYVIGAILQFFMITLIRFGYRLLLVEKKKIASRKAPSVPTVIIGGGEACRKVIRHMEDTSAFRPAAILDEASAGKTLDGIPVIGGSLADAVKKYMIQAVFLTDAAIPPEKRKEIRAFCEKNSLELEDYTGYLNNLGGRIPLSALLEIAKGPVTVTVDEQKTAYPSGEEAMKQLTERYDVASVTNLTVDLKKPSQTAYIGYDAWAKEHKEETGEDVSFF